MQLTCLRYWMQVYRTSWVSPTQAYLSPYKVNPRAVLPAVYASKCKTSTVLHFSKLIFNDVCELYSPRFALSAYATPPYTADLEQLRFYGANEITFPFKI